MSDKPRKSIFQQSLNCDIETFLEAVDDGLVEKQFKVEFEAALKADGVSGLARDDLVTECASLGLGYLKLLLPLYLEIALDDCWSLSIAQVLRIKSAETDLPGNLNKVNFFKEYFGAHEKAWKVLASAPLKGRPNLPHNRKKELESRLQEVATAIRNIWEANDGSRKPSQESVAEKLNISDRSLRYFFGSKKSWSDFREQVIGQSAVKATPKRRPGAKVKRK